ncbi:hypothetical protein [Shewanella hanedai]|uniref:Uncharacterized protein n=1 Tax=Shewanella hanedai TaxID=25 RepID=A0A553JS86_SHEHA|nr:hypothetical protein [Shewanella hanedai]TRY15322.1 hypothetical protein FN961_06550 [Shewanella hanedai]
MIKKYLGFLLVLLPVLIGTLLSLSNLEYSWFYSEKYKLYDLIYSTACLCIIIIGIALLSKKRNASLNILFLICFIVYQTLGWNFDTKRYISLIKLTPSTDILIVPYDGGAFSPTSFVNLEVSEKCYMFFRRSSVIKTFENVADAKLWLKDSKTIGIELLTYSKEKIIENVNIEDIYSDKPDLSQ